jgi:hypothetical protein
MVNARFLLLGALLLMFSYEVDAMDCSFGGLVISCPTAFEDSDKIFCCQSSVSSSIQVCCNAEDYVRQNGPMIAGIVIGALVLLCICTLCSCCFCSCCLLAKRRQRGTVLYG